MPATTPRDADADADADAGLTIAYPGLASIGGDAGRLGLALLAFTTGLLGTHLTAAPFDIATLVFLGTQLYAHIRYDTTYACTVAMSLATGATTLIGAAVALGSALGGALALALTVTSAIYAARLA